MAMSRVLKHLRVNIKDKNLGSQVFINNFIKELVDVSFVDDVAIPVIAPADVIISKTGDVVQCAYDAFSVYNLSLNLKQGESEGGSLGFVVPGPS